MYRSGLVDTLVNHTNTNGVWPNSLARRRPWLHTSSVKNKQTLSAVFLIVNLFHEGSIENSIAKIMERKILGKLEIAYGFSWPERMRLEEMVSAINSRPLDKSKYLYELRGFVSYLYHLKRDSAHPHLVQHFVPKTKILKFFDLKKVPGTR